MLALPHDELAQRYLNLWKNNNRTRLRLAAAMEGVYNKRASAENDGDGSKRNNTGSFSGGGDPTIMTTLAVLEARVTELEDDNTALVRHSLLTALWCVNLEIESIPRSYHELLAICSMLVQIGGALGSADELSSQLGQEMLEAWERSGSSKSGNSMTRGFLLGGLMEKVGDLAPSLAAKLGPIDDWLAVRGIHR